MRIIRLASRVQRRGLARLGDEHHVDVADVVQLGPAGLAHRDHGEAAVLRSVPPDPVTEPSASATASAARSAAVARSASWAATSSSGSTGSAGSLTAARSAAARTSSSSR